MPLAEITPAHFERWLALFQDTATKTCPPDATQVSWIVPTALLNLSNWGLRRIVAKAAFHRCSAGRDGFGGQGLARGGAHYWNAACERIFGFTGAEAWRQPLDRIVPLNLRGRG